MRVRAFCLGLDEIPTWFQNEVNKGNASYCMHGGGRASAVVRVSPTATKVTGQMNFIIQNQSGAMDVLRPIEFAMIAGY